jgi:hypothetical protein
LQYSQKYTAFLGALRFKMQEYEKYLAKLLTNCGQLAMIDIQTTKMLCASGAHDVFFVLSKRILG